MKLYKIKELRIKKGFSQEDMADALHVSQNTYSLIESGKTRLVDVERILIISEKFAVTPFELGLFDDLLNTSDTFDKNLTPHNKKTTEEILETLKTELAIKNKQIEQAVLQNSELLTLLSKRK